MSVLVFVLRTSLALVAVAAQVYALFAYGATIGLAQALALQCALQIVATIVAPQTVRIYATALAAWSAALVAMVAVGAWVTLVIPFAAIRAALEGDYSIMLGLFGLTAYLVVPISIFAVGAMFSDR